MDALAAALGARRRQTRGLSPPAGSVAARVAPSSSSRVSGDDHSPRSGAHEPIPSGLLLLSALGQTPSGDQELRAAPAHWPRVSNVEGYWAALPVLLLKRANHCTGLIKKLHLSWAF